MTDSPDNDWKWLWPPVGPYPVHQGLDSEMFDRTDFKYTETFVREAIQNSLDARLESSEPVIISFHFHSDNIGSRRPLLQQVIEHRKAAKLDVPDEWMKDKVYWWIVEDFNSSGLGGSLESRTSDFWGYWLNFGVSNKKGTGRGGRGIGRVTFLIASQIQSVIGYTRRDEDAKIAVCGMAALRAAEIESEMMSTHAYLAEDVSNSIYKLHDAPEFQNRIQKSFLFNGYDGIHSSGLGLAILYPHKDLNANGILAAAIENFAPAIMNNDLVIKVNQQVLDRSSIDGLAHDVASEFRDSAIGKDVHRFLDLVRQAVVPPLEQFTVQLATPNVAALQRWGDDNQSLIEKLREKIETSPVALQISFPLKRYGVVKNVSLRSVIHTCLSERKPISQFFRRGMCLPDVRDKNPGQLDIVTLVQGDDQLATYLNFCEGKAHLDLLESKEVLQKLKDEGFDDGYHIKRLIKNLPMELRKLFLPDVSEPNPRVFEKYFAMPKNGRKGIDDDNPRPPPDPSGSPEFEVSGLNDNGIRIKANPDFGGWPVSAIITFAYANGSARPPWSPHDFKLEDLNITSTGCKFQASENTAIAVECSTHTNICISGFDRNREVDIKIQTETSENA